jgi:hypothetical protein
MIDSPSLLIEVAVRWIEIGLKPATGTTALDIDLCINDRNPKTGECEYLDRCGLKDFHDPSGFGELLLQGETRCTLSVRRGQSQV